MINLVFNPYEEYNLIQEVRVAIHDLHTNSFIHKEVILPKDVIEVEINECFNRKNLRYKYQIKSKEGKWLDSTHGYNYLNQYKVKDLLNSLHFNNKKGREDSIIQEAREKDLIYCSRHILLDTYQLLRRPSVSNIEFLRNYLNTFSEVFLEDSGVFAHYHSLIYSLLCFFEGKEKILENDYEAIIDLIEHSYSSYKYKNSNNLGFKTGFLIAKGNILSAYNREQAYSIYQEALSTNTGIIDVFLIIEALTTYFSKIESSNVTYDIYEDEGNYYEDKRINLCFSADSSYFKMYALNWVQASLYFDGLNYNYGIIVDSREEFKVLVEYYNKLLDDLSNMTGIRKTNNTRFFWIKSKIINRTVYACARFYLSSYLLNKSEGDVYITDIDQFINGNLTEYLSIVSIDYNYSVYLPKMSGVYNYLPGRSHLAGNIFIRNNIEGKGFSKLLVDYVGMGLKQEFSWMLDQNAARYASEKYDIGNLQQFGKRSLQQFPDLKRIMRKRVNDI